MKLRMAFVMDPVGAISTEKDTTYVLMLEAQARGHDIGYMELRDIFVRDARAYGNSARIKLKRGADYYKLGPREEVSLDTFDVVWMRKDPPFNQDYIYATYILSLIDKSKTKVINEPSGIRESNEKLYTLYFPEWIPSSIVTKDMAQLDKFLSDAGGEIVVKPLDGHGGEGVFYVREGDRNSNVILETITDFGRRYVLAQKFIKEVREGDKRIILLNGEPLGAVLRVPKPGGEFRCNFHSGGSPAKSELTERDLKICNALSRRLRKDGLYFVGIDVIGGYITEINTTSPTGVQEINRLNGVKLEEEVIDFVEELCSH
jgi:glutathione synthase